MKRQILEDKGLTKEQIDQIMAENGKDVQAEQLKTTAKDGELSTAQETIRQLRETAKQYQGVDVEGLQTQLSAAQEKYEADLKAAKIDSAVSLALVSAKAKNVRAAKALLSEFLEKAELDEHGAVKGLEEQLKTLRESTDSAFLFESENEQKSKIKGMTPADGRDPLDKEDAAPETLSDAIRMAIEGQQTNNTNSQENT